MADWPTWAPHPLLLIAELTYRCPLHCPYCSNPTDIGASKYQDELPGEDWQRVFREAADLGVLQLALTGGEPMARKEIVDLVATSTESGLYSTLVTSALPFPKRRVEALHEAGLDHVQISFQHSDPALADEIGGTIAFERKVKAAALARELDFPLTVNCVLHRRNIDAVDSIIEMAVELGARRLELANTQYHGWATVNRDALMPTRAQLERGEEAVRRASGSARASKSSGSCPIITRSCRSRAWAAGPRTRSWCSRTATPCPARRRPGSPASRSTTCATRACARSGSSRRCSTPSAALSGCRSPAARARSAASTRTTAAAAARRWR
jgi:coenzyme PQQ biosynthesis enzyme PqqE